MPRRHLSLRVQDEPAGGHCAPASPGSAPSSSCQGSSRPTCWPRQRRPPRRRPCPAYDVTELPFLTIDPPGSMDLDQAMHLERRGAGFRVRYAIADVAAFVRPGGAIDAEAHRRVETLYSPDTRTPLHPPVLSEGAASLLPGQVRPAAAVDARPGRRRRADRCRRTPGPGAVAGPARLRGRAGPGRRRQGRRAAPAAGRGRQAADGARGRARRRQPADPGAGGRRGRRDLRGWSTA